MDLVASTQIDRRLAVEGMEGALGIELHVHFEFRGEIVAEDKAGDPAVRSFVDKLITDFVIHIDGANFLREFEGQEKGVACGSDAPADGVVGVIEEE